MSSRQAPALIKEDVNGVARKTVLIADDEKDVRRILAESLKEHDVKVIHAASGKEALRNLDKGPVDCVVLDIQMPGNGIETAIKIQRKYPQLPILFLTGFGDENRERSVEKGVRVERWIDKGQLDSLDKASAIILETLRRPKVSQLTKEIRACVDEKMIGIDEEAIYAIASSVESYFTSQISLVPIHSPESKTPESYPVGSPSLERVLNSLRIWFEELRDGYKDPAQRRFAWMQFRKIVTEQLWAACELLVEPQDKYRQQLADQFDRAVKKINPVDDLGLRQEHIKAISLSLERLSSDKVNADDVHECKKAWQLANVETLPSFSKILKEWGKYYGDDDGDDKEDKDNNWKHD